MKKAIVLGGTHDHICLFEILREKGYYTVLIDYLENPPAKEFADEHIRESTLNVEAVTVLAKTINPEIVITACIDQALLTMAYVCECLGLPCHIDYQTALALTNKAYMKQKFVENGIPTAKFAVLERPIYLAPPSLRFPLVVKPADSNSSKGVARVNAAPDMQKAVHTAFSHSRSQLVIVEEFVDGEEFSVDVAVRDSEPVIVLVTKNIKLQQNENTFTIVQSLFPATSDPKTLAAIRKIAKQIVNAYGIRNGPLLIQFIHQAGNLQVIEFSARLGGGSKHHLIKTLTGVDFLKWFVNSLFGEPETINIQHRYHFGCINYVYAENGTIKQFVNFDKLLNEGIIAQYFFYKTPGMEIMDHRSSSDRPAGYLIVDNDLNSLKNKVLSAINQLIILDGDGDDLIKNKKYAGYVFQ